MLKLKIRNICRCCSVGVVAFVVVCGWNIVMINSHPIATTTTTTYKLIAKSNPTYKLQTPAPYEYNLQSIHSTQSSSTKTTITNQPSTTHFIKYENGIYKLTLSTDGKQRRWIYVTPLHNHHNETKGNDVSGHTGNKRTVMKVSNATIPITLSTVQHTHNLYKNFNHNKHKVNIIKNDDNDIQNGNVPRTLSNIRTRLNVGNVDNRKLDCEKLSRIELKKATIHKTFHRQSNNGITNKSNDEYEENVGTRKAFTASSSFEKDENGRSFQRRRHGFNPFDENSFANDDVVNKNGLPPLIKSDFEKNAPNGNNNNNNDDLFTFQRYAIPATTQSTALIPSFRHLHQSNKFAQNDYYRLIADRHRKYILRSNPVSFAGGILPTGKYGFWDGQNKSLDPVGLQLMFTHHESILPQPHFWGIRGYGLYSFAAGNDLHNNLPNGGYKVERDFDN